MAEQTDVGISQALLEALCAIRGDDLPNEAVAPDIFAAVSKTVAREHEVNALKNLRPGQWVEGEGIFLCQYEPVDEKGDHIGRKFNVFAAKYDLQDVDGSRACLNYVMTVDRMADLQKWQGYDGCRYQDSAEIVAALKDGSYAGGWVIPPRDLLSGDTASLFKYRDVENFKSTLVGEVGEVFGLDPEMYWSSTARQDRPEHFWAVNMINGQGFWQYNKSSKNSCRPVRFVAVPS